MIHTHVLQPVPPKQAIRPIALCIFHRNHEILVREGYDPLKKQKFYRPVGGEVAFGEYSWDAIRRKIREELGEDIQNLTFIGPTENVFEYKGELSHEIIFMFEAEFANREPYQLEALPIKEGPDSTSISAVWKPIADFRRKKDRLYPEGLTEMLLG